MSHELARLMQRHPDKLIKKAKQCQVFITEWQGVFVVESPSIDRDTGENTKYYVQQYANGDSRSSFWRCGCKFCEYHPDRMCAHKLAVLLWLAQAGNQYMSAWATPQDAKRQHRTTERTQDLWVTYRTKKVA